MRITPASWCCRRTRRWAPTSWPTPAWPTMCWTSRSPRTGATRCPSAAWPGNWPSPTSCRSATWPTRTCRTMSRWSPRTSTRPASRTPPRATGSCCARCAGSTRRRPPRCGCGSGWPAPGMRSVSLAVDITNYVMLELGQPLHAFDRDKLNGPIVVRRARAGRAAGHPRPRGRATSTRRTSLITDSSGPISLAGTMGGAGHRDLRHVQQPGHRGRALRRRAARPG